VKAVVPARLSRYTPATLTRRSALLEELTDIRRTGVALDCEEHTEGISAGGFAVRDGSGTVAAISVPMPTQRFAVHDGGVGVGALDDLDEPGPGTAGSTSACRRCAPGARRGRR
jgi:DNA-binding IclR family transcriptional regulator